MASWKSLTCLPLVGLLAGLAACGSSIPRISPLEFSSPRGAALSWFAAIDDKNLSDALAHFAPGSRAQMDWDNGRVSGWPRFSSVRCAVQSQAADAAEVSCTFSETASVAAGTPSSFFTLDLSVDMAGKWLITNYGQP
jgi:hypothetical protein